MEVERDPAVIRAEIEQARNQLAITVDELAERLEPSNVAGRMKAAALAKLKTPAGIAIVGGVGVVLTAVVVRNLRRSRR